MQVRIQQLAPGMVQQIQTVCHDCQGQGERINAKDMCKTCQGRKIVRERKILEVHVDKGLWTFQWEGWAVDEVSGIPRSSWTLARRLC